ncbi:MAG: polyprenyl diphosphate synthase [Myxococcales bacterium]|nr:polyprenyl diphosphate synthase [Myxococcales bacterium]
MTSQTTRTRAALQLWKADQNPIALLFRAAGNALSSPFYEVYERWLATQAVSWRRPRHIGIIMDGNRRFARHLGAADVAMGHELGADKLRELLDWCFAFEIPVVTVWGFSLDNFKRDDEEVGALFKLFEKKTLEMVDSADLHDNHVRVRFIGRRDLLPESLQDAIAKVERATGHYERFVLNIALAYGGREELTDAFRDYLGHALQAGKDLAAAIEGISHQAVERYLYTSGLPEPDLIIRTSGEVRMSGFLMWQSAYSEYYFCDTNWPAFRKIDFLRAMRAFDVRQRRFGK